MVLSRDDGLKSSVWRSGKKSFASISWVTNTAMSQATGHIDGARNQAVKAIKLAIERRVLSSRCRVTASLKYRDGSVVGMNMQQHITQNPITIVYHKQAVLLGLISEA